MTPQEFLSDIEANPAAMTALAAKLRHDNPWTTLPSVPKRIVLLGMGSSAYAAGVAAARMRMRGLVAVAELASSDLLPHWGADTLVVAISASGASKETLAALNKIHPDATVVALTNVDNSALAARCAMAVSMQAGKEMGGVACRSFQHTLVLLMALERHLLGEPLDTLADVVDASGAASRHLLDTRREWLHEVSQLLDGPGGAHIVAPARRFSSAKQSALMLREGPRLPAVACESGDWAHVDVYLTKNTDYRMLSFAGSNWDDGIVEWTIPRKTKVISVGGTLPGALYSLRYPEDEHDDVRLLTEVIVAELAATHLWLGNDGSF